MIAKSKNRIFKIVNLFEEDYLKMKKKDGFSYQAYQEGASGYAEAITIDFRTQKIIIK